MKKNHELIVFENGRISLKERASGQTMHSKIGPWEEANSIYIEQSGLSARLLRKEAKPLVVYDVGMGIAANALAALHCRGTLGGGAARPLQLVSFENDLSGLRLALENSEAFPFFRGFEEVLRQVVETGEWRAEDGGSSWMIREGEFGEEVSRRFENCPAPEVIFYDFYSPGVQPQLWNLEYFQALRQVCVPDSVLVTYSVSTSVRVALLLAGFFVGKGRSTEAKLETTVATARLEDLAEPLGKDWLEKLRRSSRIVPYGFPYGIEDSGRDEILSRVMECEQFLGVLK
jgi:queuine tRNA-ribosyltransferase